MKAAAIQMSSGRDIDANLQQAARLIGEAVARDAVLAVLPENFSFLGATDAERMRAAETMGDGPVQRFLAEQARQHRIHIVGGTIPMLHGDGKRALSRSILVGPEGDVVAHYDKLHLFDVDIPDSEGESYSESATTVPGARAVVGPMPDARIGMSICYDLRFPGLFHRLSVLGMDVLVVPAAFTVPTGRVHWRPLIAARAIESLCYVVAAGQWGEHAGGRQTYGHSMIVAPWGETLGILESGVGVVAADLDMIALKALRARFPVLEHRREI
jgi:predicted amidohydrolase